MSTESTATETTQTNEATLIESVKKQIEYYFSKENLQTDTFLQSHMDAQMSVPISVVMKFSKMKALTSDEEVVRRALQDSTVTIVDNRIKANIKSSNRSTIILRDVPSDTPEEEVRDIFKYEGARNIVNLRSDIGDTWFVNFEQEEDAKETLLDLRRQKRTFRGVSVKARLKTEAVVRAYYPVSIVPPPAPIMGIPPFPGVVPPFPLLPTPEMFGFVMPPNMVMEGYAAAVNEMTEAANAAAAAGDNTHDAAEGQNEATSGHDQEGEETKAKASNATKAGDKTSAASRVAGKTSTATAASASSASSGRKDNSSSAASTSTDRKSGSGSTSNSRSDRKGGNGNSSSSSSNNAGNSSRGGDRHQKTDASATTSASVVSSSKPPVEINNLNFPPLFNITETNTPVPVPGYQGDYLKYTIDDVIMIVKSNVQDATLPAEVNAAEHSFAMQADVNLDLLKRQRTFTIDETREQLRQGRPVTSGLLSGSVDYRSLHYGDDTGAAGPANNAATTSTSSSHHHSSFQQQLSTIEERNEALNMSGDTLNASMLEMSMADINLNESSFLEPTPSTNALVGSTSPARMNLSSWAAMVKSAADTPQTVTSHHLTPAATTVAPASQRSGNNKAASSNNKESGHSNNEKGQKDGKKKNGGGDNSNNAGKKQEKKQDKSNNSNNNNKSNANSSSGQQSKQGRNKGSNAEANAERQAETDHSDNAAASSAGWGGKSSFASVLKQKADEEAAAAAAATSAAAATTTSAGSSRRPAGNNSSSSNSNNKASSNSSNFQRGGSNSNNSNNSSTAASASAGNSKAISKSTSINEAGGMWAKETLPPLTKNSKADALKSNDA